MGLLCGKGWIAMGTTDQFECFPATTIIMLECGSSDHKPLIIHPCGVPMKPNKPWRFKQIWLEDDGCHDTVALAWSDSVKGTPMGVNTSFLYNVNKFWFPAPIMSLTYISQG